MAGDPHDVHALLRRAAAGDPQARDTLFAAVDVWLTKMFPPTVPEYVALVGVLIVRVATPPVLPITLAVSAPAVPLTVSDAAELRSVIGSRFV